MSFWVLTLAYSTAIFDRESFNLKDHFPRLLLNTRITLHSVSSLPSYRWARPLFPVLRFSWNFSYYLSSCMICCRSLDICLGNVLVRCRWMKDRYFQRINFRWPTGRAHTPRFVILPPAVCSIASPQKNPLIPRKHLRWVRQRPSLIPAVKIKAVLAGAGGAWLTWPPEPPALLWQAPARVAVPVRRGEPARAWLCAAGFNSGWAPPSRSDRYCGSRAGLWAGPEDQGDLAPAVFPVDDVMTARLCKKHCWEDWSPALCYETRTKLVFFPKVFKVAGLAKASSLEIKIFWERPCCGRWRCLWWPFSLLGRFTSPPSRGVLPNLMVF